MRPLFASKSFGGQNGLNGSKVPAYVGGAVVNGTAVSTSFNISSLIDIRVGDMMFIVSAVMPSVGTITGGASRSWAKDTNGNNTFFNRRVSAGDIGSTFTLSNTDVNARIYIDVYRNIHGAAGVTNLFTSDTGSLSVSNWYKEPQAIGVRHQIFDAAAATLARPASYLPNLRLDVSGPTYDYQSCDTLDITIFPEGPFTTTWTGLESGGALTAVCKPVNLLQAPCVITNKFDSVFSNSGDTPPAYRSIVLAGSSSLPAEVGDLLVVAGYSSGAGPLKDATGVDCVTLTVNLGSVSLYVGYKVLTQSDFDAGNSCEFRWQSPSNVAGLIWGIYKGASALTFKEKRNYDYTAPLDTGTITGFSKSPDHKGLLLIGITGGTPYTAGVGNIYSSKWQFRITKFLNPSSGAQTNVWLFDTMGNKYANEDIVMSGYRYVTGVDPESGEDLYAYYSMGMAVFEFT